MINKFTQKKKEGEIDRECSDIHGYHKEDLSDCENWEQVGERFIQWTFQIPHENAHNALPDVQVTIELVSKICQQCNIHSIYDMTIEYTNEPK